MAANTTIRCSTNTICMDLHPLCNVVAVGLVNGKTEIFDGGEYSRILKLVNHKESCRSVMFSRDGSSLLSISRDRSINSVNGDGEVQWRIDDAHADPINVLRHVSEDVIVTGDDSGKIRLWDIRDPTQPLSELHYHSDYISDIWTGYADEIDTRTILISSGDGSLSSISANNTRMLAQSDSRDTSLTSVSLINDNTTLLSGTMDGSLIMYNSNSADWRDLTSDGFASGGNRTQVISVPSSQSVNCITTMMNIDDEGWSLDNNSVLLGCDDGLIRRFNSSTHTVKVMKDVGDSVDGMRVSRRTGAVVVHGSDRWVKVFEGGLISANCDDEERAERRSKREDFYDNL